MLLLPESCWNERTKDVVHNDLSPEVALLNQPRYFSYCLASVFKLEPWTVHIMLASLALAPDAPSYLPYIYECRAACGAQGYLKYTMRSTFRLLATVKGARFLEPGSPTGLTGLFNHPAPRSTLIYLYSATLDRLKTLPETSVYRKSTEALTQHRLKIIESFKPEGYDAWAVRAKKTIAEHPEVFNTPEGSVPHEGGKHLKAERDGRLFISTALREETDERLEEWDGEPVGAPELEGTRSTEERADQKVLGMERPGSDEKTVTWEPEPPLDASQYVHPASHCLKLTL